MAYASQIAVVISAEFPKNDQPAEHKEQNLVIAPGGPRSPEKVHPVGPNEMVRRNPDGTYTIVPDPKHGGDKESSAKD